MKTRVYVGLVTAMAGALAVIAARYAPGGHRPAWATLVILGALIATAETLQIRYYRRDHHIDAHNLVEAVLAPSILLAGGRTAVIVCAIGIAVGDVLHRTQLLKGIFNVAQWSAATAVGCLAFHALHPAATFDPKALGLLAVALLAVSVTNQALLTGVLAVSGIRRSPTTLDGARRAMVLSHSAGVAGNLVIGISLGAAAVLTPWTLLAGFVFVGAAFAAGRANLAVRADHVRLEGMQRATHALAMSIDATHALPMFLDEVRRGFEVQRADVVLFNEGASIAHSCRGPLPDGYRVTANDDVARLIAETTTEPIHVDVQSAPASLGSAIEAAGHGRLLGVPLRRDGVTIGVLALYDRIGMEGFESGELQIAAALGRELVGFLVRVELASEILEERRKLADILENTSDGILSVDNTGCITSWNAGLAAMTGRAADEMIGTRHFGLLRPRDAAGRDVLIEIWLAQMESGAALPAELQIVTAAGAAVWLSCSYSRIPAAEGRSDTLVIVARNITQARELERLKDDFVAVVSHELRTPLVPIKGWAQTLLNRGDRLSDDQRRTAVQSILAQAQKLESLVLNILEASRIEAGRVDGEGIADAGAIATRLVEDTLAARPDRRVRLRPALVPSNVRGSSVWVERAISNLLANAIKYSPDDEPVDVAVDVAGDTVLITVTDRGPGIAVEAQERIFERFERLEETRKQTGTGLGLYITRRLARAMGGDVSVSSVPGAGSTFLLRLPAAPVSSTRLPEPRPSTDPKPNNVVNLR